MCRGKEKKMGNNGIIEYVKWNASRSFVSSVGLIGCLLPAPLIASHPYPVRRAQCVSQIGDFPGPPIEWLCTSARNAQTELMMESGVFLLSRKRSISTVRSRVVASLKIGAYFMPAGENSFMHLTRVAQRWGSTYKEG